MDSIAVDAEQPDMPAQLEQLRGLEQQIDREQKRLQKLGMQTELSGGLALQQCAMSMLPLLTDAVRAVRTLAEVVDDHDTEIAQLAAGDVSPIAPDDLLVLRQIVLSFKTLVDELIKGNVPTGENALQQLQEFSKLADRGAEVLDDLEGEVGEEEPDDEEAADEV